MLELAPYVAAPPPPLYLAVTAGAARQALRQGIKFKWGIKPLYQGSCLCGWATV